MRIHTDLAIFQVQNALTTAQEAGKVDSTIYFDRFSTHRSTSRQFAYEVHLGTDVKLPGSKRRRPNSGHYGAGGHFAEWAATYDEWGWFLSALFDVDPDAKVSNIYDGADQFHERTRDKFVQ